LVNAVGGGTEALEVDVTRRELRVGDTVLLCSNGLNHAVPDEELAKRCEAGANTRALVDGLVEDAVARNAPDNVTIVVMKVVA
jgi:serine/threonine protein phosphatase PrpC